MSLLMFYGTECPHCHTMMALVDKLNAEGSKIEMLETWHNEDNNEKMREYDKGLCGGVPFFYNTDSDQFICGETEEESLRKWAKGEKV